MFHARPLLQVLHAGVEGGEDDLLGHAGRGRGARLGAGLVLGREEVVRGDLGRAE